MAAWIFRELYPSDEQFDVPAYHARPPGVPSTFPERAGKPEITVGEFVGSLDKYQYRSVSTYSPG
jgi:hypothetical protein